MKPNEPITVDEILEHPIYFRPSELRQAEENLSKAKAQLKEAVLSCVPEEENMGEPGSYNVGWNDCIDDIKANIDSLFGGSGK